jgi:DNA-binding transcriptional ArsR family regulator
MLATLSALAEPNRLRIVELLRERPRPVNEIVERLGMRQPQVSKHLRVLSGAGLVEAQPVAQQRIYRLRPQPFEELDAWLESYRRFKHESYDRLEAQLEQLTAKERRDEH